MTRAWLPMVVFAILVAFLYKGLSLNPREIPSPLIDKPAPEFKLPRLFQMNETLGKQDLLGRVWLMNVWASWCVACKQEHPVLNALAKSNAVPIVGLNYKDDNQKGKDWLKNFGDPYNVVIVDQDGRAGIDWGVYGVPESFVVDKKGMIRKKFTGPLTPESVKQELLPLVRQLNQESS